MIRNSEERARQALDEFRRQFCELVVQAKVDAMEAASPPPASAAAEAFVQHRGHAYPKDDLLAELFGPKAHCGDWTAA